MVSGAEKREVGPHHTVVFDREGSSVFMENSSSGSSSGGSSTAHLVLISGKPIGEPVAQYGPFVMNTEQELRQAMADYQLSRNGFEAAKHWRSILGNA